MNASGGWEAAVIARARIGLVWVGEVQGMRRVAELKEVLA